MAPRIRLRAWAQRTQGGSPWLLLLLAGCPNSAAQTGELQGPWDPEGRPTGCIDTPFVGPDHRSTTSGIRCGREASPEPAVVRGRVVGEAMPGLPGPSLEAIWVSLHVLDGPLEVGRLPPARAEVQTGPQGAFAIPWAGAGEAVIAVRGSRGGPVIAARRLDRSDGRGEALLLIVPFEQAQAQRERERPTPTPTQSEPGEPFELRGTEPPGSS